MIILVLMAGYEKDAQNIFDKLFKYYQEHPSKRSKHLMSWAQGKDCLKFEESSAADGDIDIAFSLLLADAQWKTQGRINYLQEAQKIINSIKIQEINHETFNILQSNSIEPDSKDYFDMRSSDFIPSELRSFIFTDSVTWQKVLTNNYNLFIRMQKKFSEGPGLIPDFIQHISIQPRPANQFYLESKYDGEYNFNASRVPWRIATDYIINGEKLANSFIVPINKWIRETTGNNPDNISAGYTLKGEDIKSRNFESLSFITSFAIAAMIDKKNQTWLNKLWDYITGFKISEFGYFDNTLKMLSLIILSSNYWSPK